MRINDHTASTKPWRLLACCGMAAGLIAAAGCEQETATTPVTPTEGEAEVGAYTGATERNALAAETRQTGETTDVQVAGSPLRLESNAPQQVRAGEEFQYELVVTNTSDAPVSNVRIRDVGDPNTQFMGGQQQQSQQQQSQQGQPESLQPVSQRGQQQGQQQQQRSGQQQATAAMIGTLAPGESTSITVVGYAPQEGQIRSCIVPEYDRAYCNVIEVVKPSLALQTSVQAPGECACGEVTVTYMVSNPGDAPAENVRLIERLPNYLVGPNGEQEIAIDVGTVEPGQTVERQVTLTAGGAGEFQSQAIAQNQNLRVRASGSDPVMVGQPSLDVSIDGPQRVYDGQDANYQVVVRNTGQVPVCEAELALVGLEEAGRVSLGTRLPAEGGVVQLGRIEPGQEIRFGVGVTDIQAGQEIQLGAAADAYCLADGAQDQIATAVQGIPALLIETIDRRDPVEVGGQTAYEITVLNQGSAPATNLQLVGQLPDGFSFVRATGSTDVSAQGQELTFSNIDTLGAKESLNWTVLVEAGQPGQAQLPANVQLQLRLDSDSINNTVQEQEPTTVYAANQGPGAGQNPQGAQVEDLSPAQGGGSVAGD